MERKGNKRVSRTYSLEEAISAITDEAFNPVDKDTATVPAEIDTTLFSADDSESDVQDVAQVSAICSNIPKLARDDLSVWEEATVTTVSGFTQLYCFSFALISRSK